MKTEEEKLTGYPSIDKPWLRYYPPDSSSWDIPRGSMYEYMVSQTQNNTNMYVLNYFGKRITYNDFYSQIDSVAESLSAWGIKEGDIITICMLSIPENVYLLYAINKLGAVCNYVAVNWTVEKIRKQIKNTNSKFVFSIDLSIEKIEEAIAGLPVELVVNIPIWYSMPFPLKCILKHKMKKSDRTFIAWTDFIGKKEKSAWNSGNSSNPAVIEYTSGTTGEPKGALIANEAANTISFYYAHMGEMMEYKKGDRFLNILPPFMAYGIFVGLHMPICLGMEVVLCTDPSPEKFAEHFIRFKPNHFTGGPLHIESLINSKKVQKMNLSFVKTAAFGGDNASENWCEKVDTFFREHMCQKLICIGYGMTETAGTFCTSTQPSKCMIPFPHNNIRIVNPDTKEDLKIGEAGEIWITGPTLMCSYYGDTENSDEVISIDDGVRWLHTGDLGYISEEGGLVISGRIKRTYWTVSKDKTINRVYPMVIEKVLNSHYNVLSSAVVGIKNDEVGYITLALVILKKKEDKSKTLAEIDELVRTQLDHYLQPHHYITVDSFPTTSAGKIDYGKIEEIYTTAVL